jgi:hypothetical protein
MRGLVLLCLLAGLARPCGAETSAYRPLPPPQQRQRALFIGNSLTYDNDLPSIVKAMAEAAGAEMEAEAVIGPGFALEDHWSNGSALAAIRRGGWSVVVLQQGPSSLPESRANLIEYAGRFAEVIRRVRARPALYMVWPESSRRAAFDAVSESYALAAKEVDGLLFPAGEAWRAAQRLDPNAPLYARDGFHPAPAGSYLAALTVFSVLFKRDPAGLPSKLTLHTGAKIAIPDALASTLQQAAAEAVEQFAH